MKKLTIFLLLLTVGFAASAQTVRYVKPNGTGNGSSWLNASGDLQLMINNSSPGDEVWVAAGTYIPVRRMDNLGTLSPGDRQNAFVARNGVKLFGGFSGTEVSKSQRNLKVSVNQSILSGDLSLNDGPAFTGMTENSYHVIVFAGTMSGVEFNGFTVASAYFSELNDTWDPCTVNGEQVHNHYGGSMYISNSSPVISNSIFTRNFLHLGSGLYTQGSGTNAIIKDCIFHNNRGYYGAAILNFQSSPQFFNTLIYDNSVLFDPLIVGLEGGDGGAVYNWNAQPVFTNCTVVNNTAAKRGGGFFHNGGTVTTRNSIVFGNLQGNVPSPTWQHQVFNSGATLNLFNNIFQDWAGGSNGNLNATSVLIASIFANPSNKDFRLKSTSVVVNAGNNSYISGYVTELDGRNRITGANVDMGAYEYSGLKKWDRGSNSNNWSDANNWVPDGVPVPSDSVVLDHEFLTGNYQVLVPNVLTSVRFLKIYPSIATDSINVELPVTNTVHINLRLTGTGSNALCIGARGKLVNNHGGIASDSSIVINNNTSFGMLIDTAGYYYHGTRTNDICVLLKLKTHINSTFEYDKPSGAYDVMIFPLPAVVGNLTFYNLIFSGTKAGINRPYGGTLANNWDLIVNGDLIIRNNASFGLVRGAVAQNRTVFLRGNILIQNTTANTWMEASAPLSFGWYVIFDGTIPQTITGNMVLQEKTTINNSAGLIVNNSFKASTGGFFVLDPSLILTNGIITTVGSGEVNINITDPSKLSGYSVNSYVNGKLKRSVSGTGVYDFPVGTISQYQLASVSLSAVTGINALTATFQTSGLGTIPTPLNESSFSYSNLADAGFWRISANAAMSGGNYGVTLKERGFSPSNSGGQSYTVVKRANDLSPWNLQGVSNSFSDLPSEITASRTGLSGFSDFAIAYMPGCISAPVGGVVAGASSVCFNSGSNYSLTGGVGNIQWQVSSSSPTGPFADILGANGLNYFFNPTSIGIYYLRTKHFDISCGDAFSNVITIDVNTYTTTTANAGTDQTFCGNTSTTLSGNTALVGTGSWTVTAGSATVTNPSSPTSTATGLSAGLNTFRWTIDNALCANSNFDEVDINVNVLPTASISGATEICNGSSATLSLVFTGTAPYTYSYSDGLTTFGPFTTSNNPENVLVSPTSTKTYTMVSVTDNNCPGTTSGSALVTVTQTPPANSVTITSIPAAACLGNTIVITTNTVIGATAYTWSTSSGTTINGQNGTAVTTVPNATFVLGAVPANSSGWDICVSASNACGVTNTQCRPIRGALSTPAVISGTKVVCENTSGTYSTQNVAGANGYTWTGTSGITFTGTGTSVIANFPSGFTSGQICVAATLSCGYTSAQRCITVTNSVGQLGVMSGPFAVCPGQSGLVFSVPATAGLASYAWTAPAGVTITSGQGTNSVTISVAPGFNIGNLCVTGTSVCGVSSISRCKTVSSTLPSTPGNITGVSTGICGQTISYSVPAKSGVTSYNWVLPTGATLASSNGNNTVDVNYSGSFTTGQLCVSAVNGCGSSALRCINVKGAPGSPGLINGPVVVCTNEQGLQYDVPSVFGATNYNWLFPSGTTIIAGANTANVIVDWGILGGSIILTASNTCGFSGARVMNVIVNCKLIGSDIPGFKIKAYPNPVLDVLTLDFDSNQSDGLYYELADITGRIVLKDQIRISAGHGNVELKLQELVSGLYILSVRNSQGESSKLSVIVK